MPEPGPDHGFLKYERFYARPPVLVVEWHDDQTSARGWLAIDSLTGGAAGGGTRMRPGGARQEAVFLAKTMAVKFRVAGPAIGGAKSVIDFDPNSDPAVKKGVLLRWYTHIAPYLRECYGTGGDAGVDEVSEATAYIERSVGNAHPQAGIVHGHFGDHHDGEPTAPKIARLRHGVEARVTLPDLPGPRDGAWMVADAATGWGVAKSIEKLHHARGERLDGRRAIIEGFGAVGAFAAYYLEKMGVRIVAASSRGAGRSTRVAADAGGLDAKNLILSRDGTALPARSPLRPFISDAADNARLFSVPADIFIPAATSHTISLATVDRLASLGVSVISCGANNPFWADQRDGTLAAWVADMLAVQRVADRKFAVIPDFIANAGMARAFGYLMSKGGQTSAEPILADIAACIEARLAELLDGHASPVGLLNRGYELFVP